MVKELNERTKQLEGSYYDEELDKQTDKLCKICI